MCDKIVGIIVMYMKLIFVRYGIFEEFVLDNMLYNSKEFKYFVSDWGFKFIILSFIYF